MNRIQVSEHKEIIYVNPHEFYAAHQINRGDDIRKKASDLRIEEKKLSELVKLRNSRGKVLTSTLSDENVSEAIVPLLSAFANNYDTYLYPEIPENIVQTIKERYTEQRLIFYRVISDKHSIAITSESITVINGKEDSYMGWDWMKKIEYNKESDCFIFYDDDLDELRINKFDLIKENDDVYAIILAISSLIISGIYMRKLRNVYWSRNWHGGDDYDTHKIAERNFRRQIKKYLI